MFSVNELLKATCGKLISGKRNIKTEGISINSRTIRPREVFIAIKGNNFDGHNFIKEAVEKGATCIIKESRFNIPQEPRAAFIEVTDTIKALGNIARFQRNKFNIPIIAVTGSNGKTTTKEMIAWVLSKRFKVLKNEGTKNNHIGLPLTLLSLNNSFDFAVLEIGSNHFGEVAYLAKICQPNIGVITNIGLSHLEYFKNIEGVFREKYTLMKNLHRPYLAILNADDSLLRKEVLKKTKKPLVLSFGIKNKGDYFASGIRLGNNRIEFTVNQRQKFILNTLGYCNIYNALMAIGIARIFAMEYREIADRLASFDFPPSRLNLLKINNINFIDDTYNSNPFSLQQALDTLANFENKGRKIFIMGDMLELGKSRKLLHSQVGRSLKEVCDTFITVGNLSKLTAETARISGFDNKNIFTCESVQQAREVLLNKIAPTCDDIILVKGSRATKMEEVFKTDQTYSR